MAKAKQTLLIVEDDLEVADMLNAYFCVQGYEVVIAMRGEDGLRASKTTHPDLIILDNLLPDMDGYELAGYLRADHGTADIPIVFFSEKLDLPDHLKRLELVADDYISKPFETQELHRRVRNALRRAKQQALNNPVTNLPDGTRVDERLEGYLGKPNWAMLIVSLENLDAYRETYGFSASEEVLRAVSLMVHNAIHESGSEEDLIGHLGPADFVLTTRQEQAAGLQERIRERLNQSLDYFYPIKNRKKSVMLATRLVCKIGVLQSSDGPFPSLDALKISLLRQKM